MTAPDTGRVARPAILTVDDDPSVSRAVARDLRRQYGEGYRIVRAESGPQALDALREIKLRGEQVAVLLADYRMPRDERHRVPGAGDGPVPAGPPGPAHRVRGHRRGDPGDQRGRPRPLPAQAVGPAGGEALPGGRRAAGRVDARPTGSRPPEIRGDRAPLVGPLVRGPRLPGPQPRAVPVVPRPTTPRRERLLAAAGRRRRPAAGGDHRRTARRWSSRPTPSWPTRSAWPPTRPPTSTT